MMNINPSHNDIVNACTYYRHDFILLTSGKQAELRYEAQEWLYAWEKAMEDNDSKKSKSNIKCILKDFYTDSYTAVLKIWPILLINSVLVIILFALWFFNIHPPLHLQ
jgi:hypothetical protein